MPSSPTSRSTTPFGIDEFVACTASGFRRTRTGSGSSSTSAGSSTRRRTSCRPSSASAGLDEAARRFRPLQVHQGRRRRRALDDYLDDPLLKSVASVAWPYLGLPPSRLDFVTFSTVLSVYLEGCFFPEGGFQSLADALVEGMERAGESSSSAAA